MSVDVYAHQASNSVLDACQSLLASGHAFSPGWMLPLAMMALFGLGRRTEEDAHEQNGHRENTSPPSSLEVENQRLRQQLEESQQKYRQVWDSASEGLWECDMQGRFRSINNALVQLTGYPTPQVMMEELDDFGRALWVEPQQFEKWLEKLCNGQDVVDEEVQLRRKDHSSLWVVASGNPIRDANSQITGYAGRFDDITRRKVAEDRLRRHAFHDKITGLPDRTLFLERIGQHIRRAQRQESYQFAVMVLDIDRFKVVNDSLGHMAGDQLLSSISRKLEAVLRPGDFLARLGGDEFGILLDDIQEYDTITQLAERIQKRLTLPTTVEGHELYSNASMGIAIGGKDDRIDSLMRDADTAMYTAKERGRARYHIFDPETRQVRQTNFMQMESELRRAVERNEFQLFYQPIVSLATGRLIGFEALVRWYHPKRGFISPGQFIPVAEDTGMILPIGGWVLRESCKQLAKWHKRGGRDAALMVSVNLSARQFTQPDLVKQVDRVLQSTGLDGGSLKLEITESAIMGNPEAAISMLKQLKAYGVKLSLDDFGTGYSSLSYLHRFPFNVLKIDQSFVSNMEASEKNEEIVRTIVALAHTLRMDVIAEGVETLAQLEHLRALKCHYGQGYYFAGPVDPDSATEILDAAPQW
jgi:diguanylate cyclase (GGDEF)-like protein/PAS domain S-box-containing protein